MVRIVAGIKVVIEWKGEGMFLGLCRVWLQDFFENGSKGRVWICRRVFLGICSGMITAQINRSDKHWRWNMNVQ
jgi:hypothetical protein